MSDNETLEKRIAALEQELRQIKDDHARACQIIHDLRTPLLTIRCGVDGQLKLFRQLLDGYQLACEHKLVEKPIRKPTQQALVSSLNSILPQFEACHRALDGVLSLLGVKLLTMETQEIDSDNVE